MDIIREEIERILISRMKELNGGVPNGCRTADVVVAVERLSSLNMIPEIYHSLYIDCKYAFTNCLERERENLPVRKQVAGTKWSRA